MRDSSCQHQRGVVGWPVLGDTKSVHASGAPSIPGDAWVGKPPTAPINDRMQCHADLHVPNVTMVSVRSVNRRHWDTIVHPTSGFLLPPLRRPGRRPSRRLFCSSSAQEQASVRSLKGQNRSVCCSIGISVLFAGMFGCSTHGAREPRGVSEWTLHDLKCDSCQISATAIGVVTEPDDDLPIQRDTRIAERRDGSLLIGPLGNRVRFAIAESNGEIRSVFGRQGSGPGEFHRLQMVTVDAGDSVVALDYGRILKFAPSGAYLRGTSFIPSVAELTSLGQGRILASAYRGDSAVYLVLNDALQVVTHALSASSHADSNLFRIVGDGEGGWWAARVGISYELTHYDSLGNRLRTIEPESTWFPPAEDGKASVGSELVHRPRSRINGLSLIGPRTLMVVGLMADPEWHPDGTITPGSETSPVMYRSMSELASIFESVIEIIDLETGAVVSTRYYAGTIFGMTPHGLAWELLTDPESDIVSMRLLRLDFVSSVGSPTI